MSFINNSSPGHSSEPLRPIEIVVKKGKGPEGQGAKTADPSSRKLAKLILGSSDLNDGGISSNKTAQNYKYSEYKAALESKKQEIHKNEYGTLSSSKSISTKGKVGHLFQRIKNFFTVGGQFKNDMQLLQKAELKLVSMGLKAGLSGANMTVTVSLEEMGKAKVIMPKAVASDAKSAEGGENTCCDIAEVDQEGGRAQLMDGTGHDDAEKRPKYVGFFNGLKGMLKEHGAKIIDTWRHENQDLAQRENAAVSVVQMGKLNGVEGVFAYQCGDISTFIIGADGALRQIPIPNGQNVDAMSSGTTVATFTPFLEGDQGVLSVTDGLTDGLEPYELSVLWAQSGNDQEKFIELAKQRMEQKSKDVIWVMDAKGRPEGVNSFSPGVAIWTDPERPASGMEYRFLNGTKPFKAGGKKTADDMGFVFLGRSDPQKSGKPIPQLPPLEIPEELKQNASHGDAQSKLELGHLYLQRAQITFDPGEERTTREEALRLLKDVIALNDPDISVKAARSLSNQELEGVPGPAVQMVLGHRIKGSDPVKAQEYFAEAAKTPTFAPQANGQLAKLMWDGASKEKKAEGTFKNEVAEKYFAAAISDGPWKAEAHEGLRASSLYAVFDDSQIKQLIDAEDPFAMRFYCDKELQALSDSNLDPATVQQKKREMGQMLARVLALTPEMHKSDVKILIKKHLLFQFLSNDQVFELANATNDRTGKRSLSIVKAPLEALFKMDPERALVIANELAEITMNEGVDKDDSLEMKKMKGAKELGKAIGELMNDGYPHVAKVLLDNLRMNFKGVALKDQNGTKEIHKDAAEWAKGELDKLQAITATHAEVPGMKGVSFAHGDVTVPMFERPAGEKLFAGNATNPRIAARGTHGLNKAFVKKTKREDWVKTRSEQPRVSTFSRNRLEPGQAALGPQIGNDASFQVIHLLGPKLDKDTTVSDLDRLQLEVQNAYEAAFELAVDQGAKFVQMPQISGGIYMQNASDDVKALWPKMINQAFVNAAQKFTGEGEGKLTKVCMVLPLDHDIPDTAKLAQPVPAYDELMSKRQEQTAAKEFDPRASVYGFMPTDVDVNADTTLEALKEMAQEGNWDAKLELGNRYLEISRAEMPTLMGESFPYDRFKTTAAQEFANIATDSNATPEVRENARQAILKNGLLGLLDTSIQERIKRGERKVAEDLFAAAQPNPMEETHFEQEVDPQAKENKAFDDFVMKNKELGRENASGNLNDGLEELKRLRALCTKENTAETRLEFMDNAINITTANLSKATGNEAKVREYEELKKKIEVEVIAIMTSTKTPEQKKADLSKLRQEVDFKRLSELEQSLNAQKIYGKRDYASKVFALCLLPASNLQAAWRDTLPEQTDEDF